MMARYITIGDGAVWPLAISLDPDRVGIEWRLRYAPDSITRTDLLVLAGIVSAYNWIMLETTAARAPGILRAYRREAKALAAAEQEDKNG